MRMTCADIRTIAVAAGLLVVAAHAAGAQRPAAVRPIESARTAAQEGRLTGRVTDAAGAPLSGVTLIVSGPALREPRTVTTREGGRFEVALPAGTFEMTCRAPGFAPWRREGIQIAPGAQATLDIKMRPAIPTGGGPPPPPPVVRPRPAPPPVVTPPVPREGPRPTAPIENPPPAPRPEPPAEEPPAPRPDAPPEHRLLEEIDRYLAQLDPGQIAFNAPGEMLVGETTEIRLLLSPTQSVEALQKQLGALPGELRGAEIKVAPFMEAVLTGPNFEIAAITPEKQAISRTEPTEWRWSVSPRAAGAQRLHLVLNASLMDSSRMLRTFDETIRVNVTLSQRLSGFAREHWQWLWTTALVPLAGWLWRRRRGTERAPKAPTL